MNDQTERLKVLGAGILNLVLTLGIARFAYTPLLPLMQQQAGLSISEGGWLASINYLGYLCGAITASFINNPTLKVRLYRIALVMAVVTTAGMGFTEDVWLWAVLRFFAGLCSAAGLLLGSGLTLNWLIRHDHHSELGIIFSGLGLGIFFCAFAVEIMNHHFDWSQQWLLFALMGVLILIPAWAWLPRPDTSLITRSGEIMVDSPPSQAFLYILMAAYFCAGVGYVVSATFIVAIVEQLPGLEGRGLWTFMLLGLASAPSCIFWDLLARRYGTFNALFSAYLLQILGILLPVIEPSLSMAVIGALLFGGTFMGIVSLILTMVGRYYPTRPENIMGKMTISYGVAQILTPAITGLLAEQQGSYNGGLYIAGGMMTLGILLILKLRGWRSCM